MAWYIFCEVNFEFLCDSEHKSNRIRGRVLRLINVSVTHLDSTYVEDEDLTFYFSQFLLFLPCDGNSSQFQSSTVWSLSKHTLNQSTWLGKKLCEKKNPSIITTVLNLNSVSASVCFSRGCCSAEEHLPEFCTLAWTLTPQHTTVALWPPQPCFWEFRFTPSL